MLSLIFSEFSLAKYPLSNLSIGYCCFGCDSFESRTICNRLCSLNYSLMNLSRLFHCSVFKVLCHSFRRQLINFINFELFCQELFKLFCLFFIIRCQRNNIYTNMFVIICQHVFFIFQTFLTGELLVQIHAPLLVFLMFLLLSSRSACIYYHLLYFLSTHFPFFVKVSHYLSLATIV